MSDSSDSESSPNTHRWNKIVQKLNDTKANTHEELKQKLKQKILIGNTRRLSRFSQNVKLEQLKSQYQEEIKNKSENEENDKNEENENSEIDIKPISEKKKIKNKEKRKKYREKKKLAKKSDE